MKVHQKYTDDIINGSIVTGDFMRSTVKRHLNDLDRAKKKQIQYWFSEEMAEHALEFVRKMRHTKGLKRNHLFDFQPNQEFQIAMVFGWLGIHEDTGEVCRRFTRVYEELARKGGKSEKLAAVGNYLTYGEGEGGAEVYSAATKLKQAQIVFNASKSMTNKFKREYMQLMADFEITQNNIAHLPSESLYEPLPANADKLDGLNPHGALVDEVHEHPDDELIKILETGMGSRVSPLMYMITTAGFNIYGPGYKIRQDNIKILKGITEDDRSCSFIYNIDEGDDWKDESVWTKPNPNIGKLPYWSYMRDQFRKAKNDGGSSEIQFKTKNLSIWTTSGKTWVQDETYTASSKGPFDVQMLRGRDAWLAMDLSTNKDLTVVLAVIPPDDYDDKYYVVPAFFCPSDTLPERSKSDKVNYELWAKEGYITATPGPVVNYKYLIDTVHDWKSLFNIVRMDYDPKFSYQIIQQLTEMGIKCEMYGQNTRDMNAPIMEIERLLETKRLEHGMHPILRWNCSNVMLYEDSNGARKFDKRKVVDRIDGMVALAMALGGYLTDPRPGFSKYEIENLYTF